MRARKCSGTWRVCLKFPQLRLHQHPSNPNKTRTYHKMCARERKREGREEREREGEPNAQQGWGWGSERTQMISSAVPICCSFFLCCACVLLCKLPHTHTTTSSTSTAQPSCRHLSPRTTSQAGEKPDAEQQVSTDTRGRCATLAAVHAAGSTVLFCRHVPVSAKHSRAALACLACLRQGGPERRCRAVCFWASAMSVGPARDWAGGCTRGDNARSAARITRVTQHIHTASHNRESAAARAPSPQDVVPHHLATDSRRRSSTD